MSLIWQDLESEGREYRHIRRRVPRPRAARDCWKSVGGGVARGCADWEGCLPLDVFPPLLTYYTREVEPLRKWKAGKKKMDSVVESAIGLEENSCTSHGTMTSRRSQLERSGTRRPGVRDIAVVSQVHIFGLSSPRNDVFFPSNWGFCCRLIRLSIKPIQWQSCALLRHPCTPDRCNYMI